RGTDRRCQRGATGAPGQPRRWPGGLCRRGRRRHCGGGGGQPAGRLDPDAGRRQRVRIGREAAPGAARGAHGRERGVMARERDSEPLADADGGFEHELEDQPRDPDYRRRSAPVRVRRKRPGEWLRRLRRHWRAELWCAAIAAFVIGGYALFFHSAGFVLASSDQVSVVGARHGEQGAVTAVFSSDLGRDIFFIPLEARRQSIEALPWVKRATVLRLWPARLQVRIDERTPVALARAGSSLKLVDGQGVLLSPPERG